MFLKKSKFTKSTKFIDHIQVSAMKIKIISKFKVLLLKYSIPRPPIFYKHGRNEVAFSEIFLKKCNSESLKEIYINIYVMILEKDSFFFFFTKPV